MPYSGQFGLPPLDGAKCLIIRRFPTPHVCSDLPMCTTFRATEIVPTRKPRKLALPLVDPSAVTVFDLAGHSDVFGDRNSNPWAANHGFGVVEVRACEGLDRNAAENLGGR